MGKVVYLGSIPNCDFCAQDNKTVPAIVDGKTVQGPWANMCPAHRRRWSVGGPLLAGEHSLENPLALKKPTGTMPTDEERKEVTAKFLENVDMDKIQAMTFDVIPCEAVDGCTVEPDGKCEHGYPSILAALGIG